MQLVQKLEGTIYFDDDILFDELLWGSDTRVSYQGEAFQEKSNDAVEHAAHQQEKQETIPAGTTKH